MPVQNPLIDANTLYQLLYVDLATKENVANLYGTSVYTVDLLLAKYQFNPPYDNVTPMFVYTHSNSSSNSLSNTINLAWLTANAAFIEANIANLEALGAFTEANAANITAQAAFDKANNVNLTGPITSVGNATAIASKTGNGNTFVMNDNPTITGTTTLLGLANVASGQIKFPTTQNASSDVKTLDDYEEGLWTPSDGSGAGLLFTVTDATYTKVGRLVHVRTFLTYPTTANTSGAVIIGLPFTANQRSVGAVRTNDTVGASVVQIDQGSTRVQILGLRSVVITNANMSGSIIVFSITYNT